MSLYYLTIVTADEGEISTQLTAKDERHARERAAKLHKIIEWRSGPSLKAPAAGAKAPNPSTVANAPSKKTTRLEKMIFRQNGRCFFCDRKIDKLTGSVEHLQPASAGGTKHEDNLVACCRTLNATFGNMGLKEKMRFVLRAEKPFRCP